MNKNNSLQANSEERIKFIEILDSLKNSGIIEYDKEDKSVFYPSKNFVSTFLEIVAERIEKNLEEGISKSQINTKKLLMISVIEATSHYKKK